MARRLTNASSSQPIWGVVFLLLLLLSLAIAAAHSGLAREVVAWLFFCHLFSKKVGGVGERK